MTGANESLPADVQPYRKTAVFTEATVPAGLLRAHTTKEGAWALIHVLEGRLAYHVDDPRRLASTVVLTVDGPPGVVEPTILHNIEPLGPIRFFVELFRGDYGVTSRPISGVFTPGQTASVVVVAAGVGLYFLCRRSQGSPLPLAPGGPATGGGSVAPTSEVATNSKPK